MAVLTKLLGHVRAEKDPCATVRRLGCAKRVPKEVNCYDRCFDRGDSLRGRCNIWESGEGPF